MQINKGDKLRCSSSELTYEVTNVGENYFDHKAESGFIFGTEIRVTKETPKPLYHDGQVVASKNTGRPFKISRHYAFGNSFRYVEDLSHEGFSSYGLSHYYEEEFIRPLTEQEKQ